MRLGNPVGLPHDMVRHPRSGCSDSPAHTARITPPPTHVKVEGRALAALVLDGAEKLQERADSLCLGPRNVYACYGEVVFFPPGGRRQGGSRISQFAAGFCLAG